MKTIPGAFTRSARPLRAALSIAAAAMLALAPAGCGALNALFPTRVTIVLTNLGAFSVDALLRISDQQDVPQVLLEELGEEVEFSIPPGSSQTFSRECEELQAVMIEDADLRVLGGIGPETSTDMLRDGDDFRCGSTINYTFSHSPIITDFSVSTSVVGS